MDLTFEIRAHYAHYMTKSHEYWEYFFPLLILTFPTYDRESPIPPTHNNTLHFFSARMPGSGAESDASPTELPRREIGGLFRSEIWWRDRYRDLEARGYRLQSRYHPDWKPSWRRSGKEFFDAEDGQPTILRATMIEDGTQVMLKKVLPEEGPHKLIITQLFSSPGLKGNPRNHCVPLLDLVDLSQTSPDGRKLMVMPFLRPFKNLRLQTYGEFVAFFTQISEGLKFMHERGRIWVGIPLQKATHTESCFRDCTIDNIMFNPSEMYLEGYHPVQHNRSQRRTRRYSRTERLPRYYLIDFGLSRWYPSREALDEPLRGSDTSAPEYRSGVLCNPFRTDIYYLGNLVREHFIQKYNGFEFMSGLVDAMTDENPAMRPTIEVVVENFVNIRCSLSTVELQSPITSKNVPILFTVFRRATRLTRTLLRVIRRRPAIPVPS